ncbi:uncharacterized protein LOC125221510 [Salvia hispanica]|uniref:uncharacterized protein LOC125185327 n=1 Tax=Salvia hispanica TaxID=49212 RepID=UPI002009D08D|nr:uncharacterized protein LOC125185327 [Salvia hispanica]XP_047979586.1 uncharacterized protein LOC125221510 [Salvia hispanica]
MEQGRMLFDASAFMLFEATGDSEDRDSGAAAEAEEEDDAQSCSSARLYEAVYGGEDARAAQLDDYSDDDEEEDGVVDQCRSAAAEAAKGCEESMRNEREGDRLFWEACLAS